MTDLESKQKDTAKHLNTTLNSDKRIADLELALSKMRQQQELLQKRVKEETDKKIKVEKDLDREQQRLKELEIRSDQQTKLLKKKTEDLLVTQRRLRSTSSNALNGHNTNSDESIGVKHCLDGEFEKILQDRIDLGNPDEVKEIMKKLNVVQSEEVKVIKKFIIGTRNFKEREVSLIDEINELQVISSFDSFHSTRTVKLYKTFNIL